MPHRKIIVRFQGGIGNQLFQYAMGRSLSLKTASELIFDNETGFTRDTKYKRRFALAPLHLPGRIASRSEKLLPWRSAQKRSITISDAYRSFETQRYQKQKGGGFDAKFLSLTPAPNLWLDGVWASEHYFSDYSDVIFKDLTAHGRHLISDKARQQIERQQTIAVHFRFFSGVSRSKTDDLSIGYYKQALDYIMRSINDPFLILFSDDMDQALEISKQFGLNAIASNNLDDSEHSDTNERDLRELMMMAHCHHIIAANSTFSWWAAWLGDHMFDNRACLVPNPKIFDTPHWTLPGLIPERWLKIPLPSSPAKI